MSGQPRKRTPAKKAASTKKTPASPVTPSTIEEAVVAEVPVALAATASLRLVDPPADAPVDETPELPGPARKVRILRNVASVRAGGGHFSVRAGAIMVVGQRVADDLIAQKVAEDA